MLCSQSNINKLIFRTCNYIIKWLTIVIIFFILYIIFNWNDIWDLRIWYSNVGYFLDIKIHRAWPVWAQHQFELEFHANSQSPLYFKFNINPSAESTFLIIYKIKYQVSVITKPIIALKMNEKHPRILLQLITLIILIIPKLMSLIVNNLTL